MTKKLKFTVTYITRTMSKFSDLSKSSKFTDEPTVAIGNSIYVSI